MQQPISRSIKQHSCFITPSRVFRKGKKHDSRQKRQENQIKNSRGGVVVVPAVVRGAEVVSAFGEALNGVIWQLTPLKILKSSIAMSPWKLKPLTPSAMICKKFQTTLAHFSTHVINISKFPRWSSPINDIWNWVTVFELDFPLFQLYLVSCNISNSNLTTVPIISLISW